MLERQVYFGLRVWGCWPSGSGTVADPEEGEARWHCGNVLETLVADFPFGCKYEAQEQHIQSAETSNNQVIGSMYVH